MVDKEKSMNFSKFTSDQDNSISDNSPIHEQAEIIDSNCRLEIKNRLVRIEYPAVVENLDKALETLGGLSGIEKAVSGVQSKLTLNFHPGNKYNKGCVAECNSNKGLLVKIKSQQTDSGQKYTYEVVGGTVRNFVFKKLVDFQYLPLVADFSEKKDSEVNYIYESIFPKELPSLESVLTKEKSTMPLFLPPMGYSRSDMQRKLNPIEKQEANINNQKQEVAHKKLQKRCMAFAKQEQPSIFHKFNDIDVPKGPTQSIGQIFQEKKYKEYLDKLIDFFDKRPIWTRSGLKYNSNFSNELYKVLLPAIAYYHTSGPWRSTWTRFGYDPRKNPESRKYQILDYRIPSTIKTNMKIGSKRCQVIKIDHTTLGTLSSEGAKNNRNLYQENSFLLRPNMLPPSRQIFYQICDLHLPEIQTMLARLPQVPTSARCDAKNGWFPTGFLDQCREVVNKYVDEEAAKKFSLEGKKKCATQNKSITEPKSTDYCSLMIKNIKRGIYKENKSPIIKPEEVPSTSFDYSETASVTEILDTDSDDSVSYSFYQELDFENDIEIENTDGDMLITTDQENLEIDVDALEDVKNIIAITKS